jgi:hypothetical protein
MTTVSQVDPIKVNFNLSEQEYLTWVAKHGPPEKILRDDKDLEKGPMELILSTAPCSSTTARRSSSDARWT